MNELLPTYSKTLSRDSKNKKIPDALLLVNRKFCHTLAIKNINSLNAVKLEKLKAYVGALLYKRLSISNVRINK